MNAAEIHDCGAPLTGAPPMHCIDPGAHHGYIQPQPQMVAGNLTGAQLEDQSAMLARRFVSIGIVADPGRMGGVVLYPDGEQAGVMLAALEMYLGRPIPRVGSGA